MTTKAYKVHVPQQYNDGTPVPTALIEEILDQALELFGGYSFNPMPIVGAWRECASNKNYIEKMYVLEMATCDCARLKEFAEYIRDTLKQECVYVVELGEVNFI